MQTENKFNFTEVLEIKHKESCPGRELPQTLKLEECQIGVFSLLKHDVFIKTPYLHDKHMIKIFIMHLILYYSLFLNNLY